MAAKRANAARIEFHAATPERWVDVESLFGPRGACAGCWCQWPRLRGADFSRGKGEPNQAIRVGHASPACVFAGVDVFGGEE